MCICATAYPAPGAVSSIGPGFAFSNISGAGGEIRAGHPGDTFRIIGAGTTTVSANPSSKTLTVNGGGVSSFNGRAGAVVPQPGDYTPSSVGLSGVIPPTSVTIPAGGTYTYPIITSSLWGRIIVGANTNNADFNMDNAGNVQIISMDSSGLILSNSNLSGHLCIGSSVAANPVVFYNRTASIVSVLISGFYQ